MNIDDPQQPTKRLTISELIEKASQVGEVSLHRRDEEGEEEVRKIKIENDGREEYFKLRRDWSFFLMCILGISIIFQLGVTLFIGAGRLDYTQYSWFINLVMGENFFQIIGLCIIVVKFLFPPNN